MSAKKIVFIAGIGGTGKTAIVYHFMENPIKGFTFYDFDRGKYKIPPYDSFHLPWRTKMNNWWLEVAHNEYEIKGNIAVISGICLYPRQIIELPNAKYFKKEDIIFGHLTCEHEVRKKRLFDRGSPHHWKGHIPWYDEFFKEMKDGNAYEIDTTNVSIKEVAEDVKDWLLKIC